MTLEEMKDVDVRSVDRDALEDISGMEIDLSLPREERCRRFLEAVRNPYCYRVGKVVVKVRFADTGRTLDEMLEHYIRSR